MERYLELLNQKQAAVQKALDITRGINLSDDIEPDAQAEAYADAYARRESVITRIMKIDRELDSPDYDEIEGKEIDAAKARIYDLAEQIVALDKDYAKKASALQGKLKSGIKKMRQGADISNAYSGEIDAGGGYYFDSKK